jgi:lysophospholipase L1-like esterase
MAFAITGPSGPVRYGDPDLSTLLFEATGNGGPVVWSVDFGTMDPSIGDSSVLHLVNWTKTLTITAIDTDTDDERILTLEVEATFPTVASRGQESDVNPGFEVSIPELGPPKFRLLPRTASWPLVFRVRQYADYVAARDFLSRHETFPFWYQDYYLGEIRKVYQDGALRRAGHFTNLLEYAVQVRDYDYEPPENVAEIGPFAPTAPGDIADLILWLDAKSLDLADGAAVAAWPDISSEAASTALQATANYRPHYHVNDGDPFVKFDDAGLGLQHLALTLPATSDGKYTIFTVVRKTDPTSDDMGLIAAFPNHTDFGIGYNLGMVASLRNSAIYATGIAPSSGFDLLTWVFDPTLAGVRTISSGRDSFRTQNVNGGPWTGAAWSAGWLGTGNGQSNFPSLTEMKAFLVFNRVLSETEIAQVETYLRHRHLSTAVDLDPEQTIVFDGDSLIVGYVGNVRTDALTTSELVLLAQTIRTRAYNLGVNGQTAGVISPYPSMTTDAATQVDPLFNSAHAKNILVVWAGTNDMAITAANPTTPFNALKAYCLARRAAALSRGIALQIVVLTALPRGITAQFETDRQAFNAAIVGDSSFYDAVVNVGANATIGDPGDQNNATYYFVDKTHLTRAGHAIVGPLLTAAIASLP